MSRSVEGRARQQARRNAYADVVLPRMAKKVDSCGPCARKKIKCAHVKGLQHDTDVTGMVWDDELAVMVPNQVSMRNRDRLAKLIAIMAEDPEAKVRAPHGDGERVPVAAAVKLLVDILAAQQEHLPAAGKLLAPRAGKQATPGLRTRTDPATREGAPVPRSAPKGSYSRY